MQLNQVPRALQARLGDEATVGLLELLDRSHREARQELMTACTECFERRLTEEISGLRVQIAQLGADLRQEMATMGADLRQEMAKLGADIRQEMAAVRVDLFKWCFLFWIGQVLAVAGIVGVMLRVMR